MLEAESKIADFSIHINAKDLILLINSATELKGNNPLNFRANLDTSNFYFDTEDRGAYFVDPIIQILFSKFLRTDAVIITTKWFEKMSKEYSEDLEVTEESISAVEQLIAICQESQSKNLDLVHIWFL